MKPTTSAILRLAPLRPASCILHSTRQNHPRWLQLTLDVRQSKRVFSSAPRTAAMFGQPDDPSSQFSKSLCDAISTQLTERNHSKWGFVVYRCDYRDDDAFNRLISLMTSQARENLRSDGLMRRLDWVLMSDKALFENASKGEIRQHFRAWAKDTKIQLEDQGAGAMDGSDWQDEGFAPGLRHQFCLHVDGEVLQRAMRFADLQKNGNASLRDIEACQAYVNMIDGSWEEPTREDEGYNPEVMPEDPADEGETEIEGCKLYDVGWMKVDIRAVPTSVYYLLQPGDTWDPLLYQRPPAIGRH